MNRIFTANFRVNLRQSSRSICILQPQPYAGCNPCFAFHARPKVEKSATFNAQPLTENGTLTALQLLSENHFALRTSILEDTIQLEQSTHRSMKKGIEDTMEMAATDFSQLAEDAKTLLAATAQVAEQKVIDARRRLMGALEDGWDYVSDKSVACCKATDETIRENPYQSVGIALGIGALLGYLFARR
ncbi:MAG TPA: hypothetical protein VHQ01_02645 [Pyrinomonadaceae bacterium]|nr:hypothetical protein [Pyrinomonadaceae bacterium]